MTSEVKQRPMLVTASYGQYRSQWVNKIQVIQRSKLRPFWSPLRMEKDFGDQNSGESRVMVTILQLKAAKRPLFEKVSLERCNNVSNSYESAIKDFYQKW